MYRKLLGTLTVSPPQTACTIYNIILVQSIIYEINDCIYINGIENIYLLVSLQ